MSSLSDIRDWVREETLVETTDWSNVKINNTINEALRQLSTRFPWPFLASSTNLSVTDGVQAYSFDTISDFAGTGQKLFSIASIVDNARRVRLQELSQLDADVMYGGDPPDGPDAQFFYTWGESIYLIPVPDETEVDSYLVRYYRSATELSNDGDEPEWDPSFHLVLADYAIARVWEREEEIGKAESADARFDAGIERMAQFYLNRAEDSPLVMGAGKSGRYAGHAEFRNMPWLQ